MSKAVVSLILSRLVDVVSGLCSRVCHFYLGLRLRGGGGGRRGGRHGGRRGSNKKHIFRKIPIYQENHISSISNYNINSYIMKGNQIYLEYILINSSLSKNI